MLQPLNAVEALETTIVLSMAQPASDRTNVIAQGSDHVDEAAGPGMGRAGLLDVSSTLGTRQKRGVGGAPPLASKGFCACAGSRAVEPKRSDDLPNRITKSNSGYQIELFFSAFPQRSAL